MKVFVSLLFVFCTISMASAKIGADRGGFQVIPLVDAELDVEIVPIGSTTFTINGHMVWASAIGSLAALPSPECDCAQGPIVGSGAADVHPTSASAGYDLGLCSGLIASNGIASSQFTWLGSTSIHWEGWLTASWVPWPLDSGCITSQASSLSVGFFVSFSSSGMFELPPPACPPAAAVVTPRVVSASFFCANGEVLESVSSRVKVGEVEQVVCPVSATVLPAGSYELQSITLDIDDAGDDVTGDGRFNQADVDFLQSLVGTAAANDPFYTSRFDFDEYFPALGLGEVDAGDVEILQCFINSGLSAGYIGDASQDGDLGCADIFEVMNHPFAGEMFPPSVLSVYKVELDTDLDGDNDLVDKAVVVDALRLVEPANYFFDDVINFFDASEFLSLYNSADPRADIAAPFGTVDFFDFSQFLVYFNDPQCL